MVLPAAQYKSRSTTADSRSLAVELLVERNTHTGIRSGGAGVERRAWTRRLRAPIKRVVGLDSVPLGLTLVRLRPIRTESDMVFAGGFQ